MATKTNNDKCVCIDKTDTEHYQIFSILNEFDDDSSRSLFNKKKKKLEPFYYFTKKQWKYHLTDIADEQELVYIVGNVNLGQRKYKEVNEKYTCKDKLEDKIYGVLKIPYTQEYIDKHNLECKVAKYDVKIAKPTSKNLFSKTVGYVQVGQNKYIRLVKHSIIPLLLLLILLAGLIMGICFSSNEQIQNEIDEVAGNSITQQEEVTNNDTNMAENHYLYVWNSKTVDENHKTVALVNHPENDVYLCYDIYDEYGNKLDSTGSFQPNTQIDYDFYSLFNGKTGKYNLILQIKVNDLETKEPLCSKTMPVVINVQ